MAELQDAKRKYADLCSQETGLPIFAQPCGWMPSAVRKTGVWFLLKRETGSKLRFRIRRNRMGVIELTVPSLTPALGPRLCPYAGKNHKMISREKDL